MRVKSKFGPTGDFEDAIHRLAYAENIMLHAPANSVAQRTIG